MPNSFQRLYFFGNFFPFFCASTELVLIIRNSFSAFMVRFFQFSRESDKSLIFISSALNFCCLSSAVSFQFSRLCLNRRTNRLDELFNSFINHQFFGEILRHVLCMNKYHLKTPKVNTLASTSQPDSTPIIQPNSNSTSEKANFLTSQQVNVEKISLRKSTFQISEEVLHQLDKLHLTLQLELGKANAPYTEVIVEEALVQLLESFNSDRATLIEVLMSRQKSRDKL
ncbi:hypothetical protein Npun_F3408 [Nostoc punctiforme PCC 73102]|uniref:Uncharacterized protein n=2 Tax=Nostoc punctiforme TaxID=272131 RepID=B2J0X2_NOSP7|nr:hypothetical protein Npun_F3408 [Nostoc punctiforme PCC 73102]